MDALQLNVVYHFFSERVSLSMIGIILTLKQ